MCCGCETFGLAMFQQIRDLIIDQAALGADGGGKETEIRGYAAILTDQQFTTEGMTCLTLYK